MIALIAFSLFFLVMIGLFLYFKYVRKPNIEEPKMNWDSMVGFAEYCSLEFVKPKFLKQQAERGFNLTRVWIHDVWQDKNHPTEHTQFLPYKKDGSKYDLDQWNDTFFSHLKTYIEYCRSLGIIVILTLFDDCGLRHRDVWEIHCYNSKNNVQKWGSGQFDIYKNNYKANTIVKKLIDKIMNTVGHCDNIIWEYCNEAHHATSEWVRRMKTYVEKDYGKAGYTCLSGFKERHSSFVSPHNIDHVSQMNGAGHLIYSSDGRKREVMLNNMKDMIAKARNENKHLEIWMGGLLQRDGSFDPEVIRRLDT